MDLRNSQNFCYLTGVIQIFLVILLMVAFTWNVRSQETAFDNFVDVSALKCPSSWDEVAKRFRSENYWIFQRRRGEQDVSMVLRPNRETGTWRQDVDTRNSPMTVTPQTYQWESVIFTGINTLDIESLTLDRNRTDSRSSTSRCEVITPQAARRAVRERDRG